MKRRRFVDELRERRRIPRSGSEHWYQEVLQNECREQKRHGQRFALVAMQAKGVSLSRVFELAKADGLKIREHVGHAPWLIVEW